MPKDCSLHKWSTKRIVPSIMPNIPKILAKNINGKRSILMEMAKLNRGIVKEAIPVNDTMITIGADTIPASTAAVPMTSAPRMLTVWPMVFGRRTPLHGEPQRRFP